MRLTDISTNPEQYWQILVLPYTKYLPEDIQIKLLLQPPRILIVDQLLELPKLLEEQINILRVVDIQNYQGRLYTSLITPPKNLVAVTGTNGKTSVVNLFCQLMSDTIVTNQVPPVVLPPIQPITQSRVQSVETPAVEGHSVAGACVSLGTLGKVTYYQGKITEQLPLEHNLTTPHIYEFYSHLEEVSSAGIDTLAYELSSHALVQQRTAGAKLQAACITNLGHDHLDYHSSLQAYHEAKLGIVSLLEDNAPLVVNSKLNINYKNVIKAGLEEGDIYFKDIKYIPDELAYEVKVCSGGVVRLQDKVYLPAKYYLENTLYSLALAMALGRPLSSCKLHQLKPIAGRFEVVKPHNENHYYKDHTRAHSGRHHGNIIIDYAHTPCALLNVARSCRDLCVHGKLIIVFGCGGERDTTKRAEMGQIAAKIADIVIVTDDNPRHEDAQAIRTAILEGCNSAPTNACIYEIAAREEAIVNAIKLSRHKDIVLIAGKGHEKYQLIGDNYYPFSDYEIASRLLS